MTLNLTTREQELLCAVIDVMKADIDWKAVAPKANYNTAKQARDKWPAVRNKITASVKATDKTTLTQPTTYPSLQSDMSLTLNPRQQALLIAVVRNMTADIDWDKVAAEADYGTAKSARDNWNHTRKKIESTFSGAGAGASSGAAGAATTVKKGIARKRKAGDEKETPGRTKSKKKVEKEMTPADDDDLEEKKEVFKDEVKDEVKDEEDDEA